MSHKASCKILEQRIQALELENTTLKQDIAALKEFQTIESMFETAPIGLAVLSGQKIIRVNRCLCDISGYSMAELTGCETRIFFPDEASYQDILTQKTDPDVLYGRKSIETRWQTKDGRIIDIWLTYALIDESDLSKGMTVSVQDITTEKRNEDFLKFQAKVLNSINDIVRVVDLEGNTVYVNDTYKKVVNVSQHQITGKAFDDLVQVRYLKNSQENIINKTVKHGTWQGEVTIISREGRIFDLDVRTQLIHGHGPEAKYPEGKYIVGIATDITEKKKSEKERELLLAAMEQTPQTVFITNSEGIIEYVNNAFECQTGYSRPDCIGMDLRMLRSNKHDSQFYINLWATISSGRMWNGHTINKRRDGSFYTADTTISSVSDDKGTITNYVYVQRDISNEIEINEKIARIQKFESLGTLAGGMVHDLNNMLLPILGNSELLLLDSSAHSDETRECLEQIFECALQAKDLVQQVLTFSRHKKIERHPLQIQSKIDTVLKLMKPGIPRNISIEKYVDPGCPAIVADSTQIHQIIINLISNGVHAMADTGGVIKISLMPVNVSQSGSHGEVKPGKYTCLNISDTGTGMSKEVKKHIFEPFYTTKTNGKGTGMGLSVVYGIVKDMDGGITVHSRPGKGSEFKIYFPTHSAKNLAEKADIFLTNERTGIKNLLHVLFVDDEDIILKVAKSMLDRLGCRATTMTDPLAALARFKKDPLAYDLVITDMYMPHMNGDCLAQSIKAIRTDIPVFICTGFSNDISSDMMVQTGIRAVLSKPLSIKEISDKIGEILKPKVSAT